MRQLFCRFCYLLLVGCLHNCHDCTCACLLFQAMEKRFKLQCSASNIILYNVSKYSSQRQCSVHDLMDSHVILIWVLYVTVGMCHYDIHLVLNIIYLCLNFPGLWLQTHLHPWVFFYRVVKIRLYLWISDMSINSNFMIFGTYNA